LDDLPESILTFIDARPNLDIVRVGAFDIGGLLALLQAQVMGTGAKLIVFDAIDILLAQMGDPEVIRREIYRLQNWLSEARLTAIITAKTSIGDLQNSGLPSMEFVQYMVDCWVVLSNDIVDQISQRNLRIAKYRGSDFHGNAVPFLIGRDGIDVAFVHAPQTSDGQIGTERISSGMPALDDMLRGGYLRAACVLLTGLPGTAKTTICGAFVAAACARGEKTLYVSFVSREDEIIRNLKSVSIDLEPYIASGLLRMESTRASKGSAETHLMSIRSAAQDHDASCIVTDPLSALSKTGNRGTAPGVSERLIDWAKAEGRTVVCTSLLDSTEDPTEATPLQISTIADTWIHLTNEARGGERNRTLSIIKSRGTGHSNQVRELVLADSGMTLRDVFAGAGEVLVGSERWESEREDLLRAEQRAAEDALEASRRTAEVVDLESRIALLQGELRSKMKDNQAMQGRAASLNREEISTTDQLRIRRGEQSLPTEPDHDVDK
jgi:circadian clock protein KaiC